MTEKAKVNLGWLSDYRTEIMGACAIGIILCHANLAHVALPSVFRTILGMGNFCVDIFLLLSGIGICFSLEKLADGGLGRWYARRFMRIIIPYLIIYVPYYLWRCIANQYSIWRFFYYISTLGYWMEHDGAWFLALLIPLYLISPFLYKFLKNRSAWEKYIICGVISLALYVFSAHMCLSIRI
jgi:surface polysaccharide O-acyltransferase-like enzyme